MRPVLILLAAVCGLCIAQIPARQRGYALRGSRASTVSVELFYDLLCDDSKANWAITKELIDLSAFSEEQFGLQLNVFPLPYHHHAFYVATAFRAYMTGMSKTHEERVACIESIFSNQENFLVHDAPMGETELVADIIKFFNEHCSANLSPIFANSTVLRSYNLDARADWKYAAARTVHGTPSFSINGFLVDDAGDYTVQKWIDTIKQLLSGHDE